MLYLLLHITTNMMIATFAVGTFYILIALVACDDHMLPKWLGSVSKNGVPYKLLTAFYICGMIPLIMRIDLASIQKFTVANSLLSRLFVCAALFLFAKKHAHVTLFWKMT